MNHLHEMLIEDEIILCGVVMMSGVIAGIIARVIYAIRQRRAAGQNQPHSAS